MKFDAETIASIIGVLILILGQVKTWLEMKKNTRITEDNRAATQLLKKYHEELR